MSADVLERNVRLLLRRSYVPALPAPPFRDRLESLFLAEAARRARRPAAARRPRRWLAAAAVLLGVLLGWRVLAGPRAPTRAGLLARGEVALCGPEGDWRAADAEERAHGVRFRPPSLVALTPGTSELELLLDLQGVAARVHLAARSELRLEAEGGEAVSIALRAGAAWLLQDGQRRELVPGRILRVPEEPAPPATPEPSLAGTGRREAAPPSGELAPEATAGAPARALHGRLIAPPGSPPPTAFTVGLLSERIPNRATPPVVREFRGTDGTFLWPDPPGGKQRVFVHAPGFALCALGEHDLGAGLELDAELTPGSPLRGSVLDEAGNPVAGALVLSQHDAPTDGLLLEHSENAFWLPVRATTGPDGRFELAHLRPGEHSLRVTAPGFAPLWEDAVAVPAAPGQELLLTLTAGGTVEGLVTREDGGPWADAELVIVAMDEAERACMNFALARTGIDGRYRFEHLPAMTMIVVLMRTERQPDVRPVQVIEGGSLRADFLAQRTGIRVHGRLLRRDRPVADQNIGLFDSETSSWSQDWIATTTREDGRFLFEGARPGRHLIFLIDQMGRGVHCVDEIELAPGENEVEHEVRVPLGRLEVRLREAAGTAPVGPTALILSRVGAERTEFAAFGVSEGERHVFEDVLPGRYRVVAYPTRSDLGFASSETLVIDGERPDGEAPEATLELALEPGGPLDVVVRSSTGQVLEGAAVVFHDEAGEEHLFSRDPRTDAAGRYRANGLRPGRYRVEASLDGYRGAPVSFSFELGRELEVPLLLTPIPSREPAPPPR